MLAVSRDNLSPPGGIEKGVMKSLQGSALRRNLPSCTSGPRTTGIGAGARTGSGVTAAAALATDPTFCCSSNAEAPSTEACGVGAERSTVLLPFKKLSSSSLNCKSSKKPQSSSSIFPRELHFSHKLRSTLSRFGGSRAASHFYVHGAKLTTISMRACVRVLRAHVRSVACAYVRAGETHTHTQTHVQTQT